MRWLGSRIIARPILIWMVFMVLGGCCGSGLYHVKTTINLMSLFSPDAEIIHSYRWLEEELGPLVPMEVVVRIDREQDEPRFPASEIELVERIQAAIDSIPNVGSAMSAATFAPDLTPPKRTGRLRDVLLSEKGYRTVLNKRLDAHRDDFVRDAYLAEDPKGEELWRISLRVAALADIDYGAFINDIKKQGRAAAREGARPRARRDWSA